MAMTTKAGAKDNRKRANPEVVKPHAPDSGFGFARKKDINDQTDHARAPRGPQHAFDRTGDQEFSKGMKAFEKAGGSQPARDPADRNRKSPSK